MKHKTAVAAAGSVVAVLLAGSAAIAANFGILSSADTGGDLQASVPTLVAAVPSSETTEAGQSDQGELLAYQVQGVGIVTLRRIDETLALESVSIGDGWTYAVVPTTDGSLSITFTDGSREVHFSGKVQNDEVSVSVEEVQTVTGSTPRPTDDEAEHHENESHDDDD